MILICKCLNGLITMLKKLSILTLAALITSCSGMPKGEGDFPKSRDQQEEERIGKITGEDGITVIGGKKKNAATDGINVNSYLWRATLDTVAQMPIISADPFGGTILTDWYVENEKSQERFKLNVFVIGAELRADAIKVSAFKQKKVRGAWGETLNAPELSQAIEDKILLKAREIKFNSPR